MAWRDVCVDQIKCCILESLYLGMGTCGTSALTAVMSPLSTVGELDNLALWYAMYAGSFGGGAFLVSVSWSMMVYG